MKIYYIAKPGVQEPMAPVSLEDIREGIRQGKINSEWSYFNGGMKKWQPIYSLNALSERTDHATDQFAHDDKITSDKKNIKSEIVEHGCDMLCSLVSLILPVIGLSYSSERGFHINILKLVFYTGVLIALLVVTGNIGIAYLGTCVARLLIQYVVSEF